MADPITSIGEWTDASHPNDAADSGVCQLHESTKRASHNDARPAGPVISYDDVRFLPLPRPRKKRISSVHCIHLLLAAGESSCQ